MIFWQVRGVWEEADLDKAVLSRSYAEVMAKNRSPDLI